MLKSVFSNTQYILQMSLFWKVVLSSMRKDNYASVLTHPSGLFFLIWSFWNTANKYSQLVSITCPYLLCTVHYAMKSFKFIWWFDITQSKVHPYLSEVTQQLIWIKFLEYFFLIMIKSLHRADYFKYSKQKDLSKRRNSEKSKVVYGNLKIGKAFHDYFLQFM